MTDRNPLDYETPDGGNAQRHVGWVDRVVVGVGLAVLLAAFAVMAVVVAIKLL